MKSKKLFIIVAALVIVSAVSWLVSATKDGKRTPVDESQVPAAAKTLPNATEAQSVVISYTDSGFGQVQVVINPGDSVVFRNDSTSSFWPASDPHPVHTELSAFDARSAVAPGQSYTMTFEQSGNWGFHNHLNSSEMGTVSVR